MVSFDNMSISYETVLQGILKSSFLNIFARLFGYLKNVAIAVIIGFSFETDAFFMAISLIGIFMIFVDVFDSVGIPNLVKARQESQEYFHKLSALLFTFTIIIAIFVVFLSFILMPLVFKVAIGFKGQEQIQTLKILYIYLLPYLLFSFLFHHFGAINRSLRRFSIYFIGQLIFSFFNFIFITIGLIIFRDIKVIPISFSISQGIATLYILLVSKDFLKFDWFIDNRVKEILKQFFYLIFIYGVLHLFIVIDRVFASLLPAKSITALSYGLTIASIPRGILRLEDILITPLSEVNASMEKVNFYLKRTFLITLSISIIFYIFSPLFVKILYGYGAFSHVDYELTSLASQFYSLCIPYMLLWSILYRVFQIRKNLGRIVFVAIISCILNGILNYLLVIKLNLKLIGVCLGTLGAYLALVLLSYYLLIKENKNENRKMSSL